MSEIESQVGVSVTELKQEYNTITHNLANVSTAGYKRRVNSFSQALKQQAGAETGEAGDPAWSGAIDFSQGDMVLTGRPLDVGLCGKGFFVIETVEGPLYSRHGVLHLNQHRQIVDSGGRLVAGEAGPITIPANVGLSEVVVSSDGSISDGGAGIGRFRLVDFKENEQKLVPVGMNCFQMPEQIQPQAAEQAIVKQGFQEASNVEVVEELVDMIMVSRLYEANMKFVAAAKEISGNLLSVAMG